MSKQPHSEREHSPVGASGFSRWSVCAGSVRISQGLERRETVYSAEGTAAHEILERCMKDGSDAWEHASAAVTDEMVLGIQVFLDTVRGDLAEYTEKWGRHPRVAPLVLIEQRFSLAELGYPDAYGTADVAAYFPEWRLLRIYDFKFGAGMVVEVENNGQTRYYAAGTILDFPKKAPVHEMPTHVESVIVQPRCEHDEGYVRRERLTIDELDAWVEGELLPAIERTRKPDAPLVAGPHCRFCPAKAALACPLLAKDHTELTVAADRAAPKPAAAAAKLEDWELAERLAKIGPVEMYIRALKDEAFVRIQRGGTIPGWKLVPKKSDRVLKVGAEEEAKRRWGDDAYTKPSLKGIPALEKLPGGKDFAAEYAYKPDRGLTIAPDTDKRGGVRPPSVRAMFAGVIEKA